MSSGRSSEGSAGRRASLIDKLKQTYRTNTADDSLGRRASFIDRYVGARWCNFERLGRNFHSLRAHSTFQIGFEGGFQDRTHVGNF